MKLGNIKNWSTEKISQRILYVLTGLIVLFFAAFYLIGYDNPYIEDPNFNDPLFTGVIITFMIILVLASVATTIWALVQSFKKRSGEDKITNGIPAVKISYATIALTVVSLLVTFALSSSSMLVINGVPYQNAFWLKVSGMFVNTSLILVLVALGAVVFGATRYTRKIRKNKC